MSRLPSPHGPALPLRLPGWRSDLLRLAKVIWPFLLTMPLLVGIAVESFGLLTAGRAFVTGESLWSKAQKDAIQALARYSLTCDRHALADYEHAIAGPMGYRVARLELLERDPDLARARAGFIQGGSDPEDVDGMIQLFRRASDLPLMREAIRLWGEGDALLAELDAQAQNLALRRAGRCDDLEGHREAMAALDAINRRLTPIEEAFSDTLGHANRLITHVLLGAMVAVGAALTAVGVSLSWRVTRRSGRAERALARNEYRLRLALSGSTQGLFDVALDVGDVYVSSGLCALFGLPRRARRGLQPRHLLALIPPAERRATLALLARHARERKPFNEEIPLRTAAGERRLFRVSGHAKADAHGRPTRFVASVQDVTEHRRMQDALHAELQQRREALRTMRRTLADAPPSALDRPLPEAADDIDALTHAVAGLVNRQQILNDRLTAILELSPDGFVSFNAAGRVSHVSPAFERLTGLCADEVLGLTAEAFVERMNEGCAPGAGLPSFDALRRAAGSPIAIERSDGSQRVLDVELREGVLVGARSVLCLRDVTRDREVDRLKTEFMTIAAHELRTPMSSIHGFVDLLRSRPMSAERRDETLAIVHRQTEVIIGILDNLLDLNRLQARRRQVLAVEPVDAASLLRAVATGYPPPPGRARPAIASPMPPCMAWGHPAKLTRALNQLLHNAYKFSSEGAVIVSVVEATDGSDRVGLRVQDQGIGMTAAQAARAGERFWRADASGHLPGTGLGISIVKEIAGLHGGALDIDSLPGSGTTVTLWLPRAEMIVVADGVEAVA